MNNSMRFARQISARYPNPWHRHYAWWKLKLDPLYQMVATELGDGAARPALDIGCGLGIAAAYLRLSGFNGHILGIDIDEKKVLAAKRDIAGWIDNVEFKNLDMRQLDDFRGHVLLLDVLQFLERDERDRLLLQAAQMADSEGSKIIIRSTIASNGARFAFSVAGDILARLSGWMNAHPTSYPTIDEISAHFPREQFTTSATPLRGSLQFNNYFISITRK